MASFKNVTVGQVMSEIQYYKVEKIAGDRVQLVNDFGESIVVDKGYVEKCLTSASEVTKIEPINKTDAATLFLQSSGVAMTVNFNKQVKSADVLTEVMDKIADAKMSEVAKAVKAGLDKALSGEARTMIGRHYGDLNELGRVNFIDMEVNRDKSKDYENRLRQVDPRSINWMIIRGVKYEVKSK